MKLHREESNHTHILILGLPNVGKTTFQDVLRSCGYSEAAANSNKYVPINWKRDKKVNIRAEPGTTNAVENKVKVSANPTIYTTDTPGIFHKRYPSPSVINKLSMANILQRKNVGNLLIADYILFELNRQRNFEYVKALDLPGPVDDLQPVLLHICQKNNLHTHETVLTGLGKSKIKAPSYNAAAGMMIRANEVGLFGTIFWDQDLLDTERLAVQGTMLRYKIEDVPEGERIPSVNSQTKRSEGAPPDIVEYEHKYKLELPE